MRGLLLFAGHLLCGDSSVNQKILSSAALRRCVAMLCCALFSLGTFFLTSCTHVPNEKFSVDESLTAQIVPQEHNKYSVLFELVCKEEVQKQSSGETCFIRLADVEDGKWAEYHVSEGDKSFRSSAIIQSEKVECDYGFGVYAKFKIQKIDAGRVSVIGLIADVRRNKDGSVIRKTYPVSFTCKLNERMTVYSFSGQMSCPPGEISR